MVYETKDSGSEYDGRSCSLVAAESVDWRYCALVYAQQKPDWLHITGSALIVQRDDSLDYNQLAGRELKGYFINNQMRKVDIIGNAVSVFFPKTRLET